MPDELWAEFGRLTNWKGQITKRPKYWGKLVMELIYEKLDADVAKWLKEHAPAPKHGQNYHQWLSGRSRPEEADGARLDDRRNGANMRNRWT